MFERTAPLKGIPSRNTFGLSQGSGFKAPSNPVNKMGSALNNRSRLSVGGIKRDGGIKLLDITEQPLGRDSKRRKKVQNEETDKQKDIDKKEAEPITPDYAAGLTSSIPPSPAPPSYAPPATPAPQPTVVSNENFSQMSAPIPSIQTQSQTPVHNQSKEGVVAQKFVVTEKYQNPVINSNAIKIDTKVVSTPMVTPIMTATPQLVQQLQTSPALVQVTQQTAQPQQQTPQQPLVRKQLQLSREQMFAAQEMFNNSNRVTRPEKALILGFMAGSRENPCPQLGNVVTIKLSEKEEDVRQSDQTVQRMIVETHFQMNYNTGEWKQVQKFRKLDQNVQNAHQLQQQYQTLQQTV